MNVAIRVALSAVLAFSAVAAILFTNYKVVYKVFIDGEEAGYVGSKIAMERKIDEFVQNGDTDNVAYVVMNSKIDYELMLLKKDTILTDGSVLATIKDNCDVYRKVYAISVAGEESLLVETEEDAQKIIDEVNEKQQNFAKQTKLEITEKVVLDEKCSDDIEIAVNTIFEPIKKENDEVVAKSIAYASQKTVSKEVLQALKENLRDLDFGKPIKGGIITSKYGWRSTGYHYGLDIADVTGTEIYSCEAGVVTFSGWSGSYGYIVKIQHSGGYETYYAHCSKLLVDVGDEVSKGDLIALMGSTGRSTGPHVHLEVRYDGQTLDPEAFVYDK